MYWIPFSCLFIYEVMKYFVKKDVLAPYASLISWTLIVLSAVLLFLFQNRTYPVVLFLIMIIVLLAHLYILKATYMGRFYLSFGVSIVPFLIVNGLLTGLPIITYNAKDIMGLFLFTIPLEDLFYGMLMLLLITSFYEYFNAKKNPNKIRF